MGWWWGLGGLGLQFMSESGAGWGGGGLLGGDLRAGLVAKRSFTQTLVPLKEKPTCGSWKIFLLLYRDPPAGSM